MRDFEDLADLQAQHDAWAQEVAFRRHHRRVGGKVGDAWAAERGFLGPLPDPLPDTDRRVEVRVTKDGFCRMGDVDYSVPPGLSGRKLQARISTSEVVIFSEGREIARHQLLFVFPARASASLDRLIARKDPSSSRGLSRIRQQ